MAGSLPAPLPVEGFSESLKIVHRVIFVVWSVAAALSWAPAVIAQAEPSIPSRDVDLAVMGTIGAALLLTGLGMLLLVRRRRKPTNGEQSEELGADGHG
jgi:MYXO-CTERM domain-containing protein